ncbi:hypothetical protein GW17_00027054 [Ensete ventricosum]|nr:hypothetical protein GW17_00027054 [Ensete ventricosum]RZS17610.1 hypothetical protein BHM03_00049782 [Ensete ventricosum]
MSRNHTHSICLKEGVAEMIKFLANEPSVGLFFVEQHAQTSMLYLGLKQQSHNVLAQNDIRFVPRGIA